MRLMEHVAYMENTYKILVKNSEGKRPHGSPTHRWETILKWILGKWSTRM